MTDQLAARGTIQRALLSLIVFAGALSCGDAASTLTPKRPTVSDITVVANPENALSVLIALNATAADSVRVRYSDADSASVTPFYRLRGSASGKIAVFGLRPSTKYSVVVEAIGPGGTFTSATASVTTPALPPQIASLRLSGAGSSSPGYTLVVPVFSDTTADGFIVAFDETGDVRWYHRFPGEWPIEAKQQPNGNTTVYVGRSFGWQTSVGRYVELTPAGDIARTFAVANGYYTDPHEMLLGFNDTTLVAVHLLGYEIRSVDLSAVGGSPSAQLAVHTIERQSPGGSVDFRWSAGSMFSASDWPIPNRLAVDLDHPSSLGLDLDGNYVVSFQAMDEITKINATTGAIVWRFGGKNNQFRIDNDPLNGFSGQHDVQVLENGHLLLMDNHSRTPPVVSRAAEYSLDTRTMTASLVWELRPTPTIVSPIMGSVQRQSNGATLIGFGAAGRVLEVQHDGRISWDATLRGGSSASPISFYRAVRVRSLYGR